MFERYAALAFIAGGLAACSNDVTAPTMAASSAPAFSSVSSPNTAVNSAFVIFVGGSTYYAGSGPSRNGQGECHSHTDGTVGWYWVPGNIQAGGKGGKGGGAVSGDQENGPNHAQCAYVNEGYQISVTFAEISNYVKSTSGNFQLNFNPFCVPNVDVSLPPTCDARYVHYKSSTDFSQGYGLLHGTGVRSDDGSISDWTIDLSQIHASSNLINDPPRQLLVTAHNTNGLYPDSPTTISW